MSPFVLKKNNRDERNGDKINPSVVHFGVEKIALVCHSRSQDSMVTTDLCPLVMSLCVVLPWLDLGCPCDKQQACKELCEPVILKPLNI